MARTTKRSSTARQKFLKGKGLTKTPKGKEIDHKVPLSKGGSDSPRNMRIIKKNSHKTKTASEARKRQK